MFGGVEVMLVLVVLALEVEGVVVWRSCWC